MLVARACSSRLAFVLLGASLVLAGAPAKADDAERYRLSLSAGYRVDRFQWRTADSLRLWLTQSAVYDAAFDFRVVDAPMKGAAKPSLHVFGHGATSRRAFGTEGLLPEGQAAAPLDQARIVDLGIGVALHVPMGLVDRGAGSDLVVSYEGGLALATATEYQLMVLKRVAGRFERTAGFFQGSLAELGFGHDDGFGKSFSTERWTPRLRIQARLISARSAVPATAPAKPGAKAAPAVTTRTALISAFIDLAVDTDGRAGPDGIRAIAGGTIDLGATLHRMMRTGD